MLRDVKVPFRYSINEEAVVTICLMAKRYSRVFWTTTCRILHLAQGSRSDLFNTNTVSFGNIKIHYCVGLKQRNCSELHQIISNCQNNL
jgi:hypothetical protein